MKFKRTALILASCLIMLVSTPVLASDVSVNSDETVVSQNDTEENEEQVSENDMDVNLYEGDIETPKDMPLRELTVRIPGAEDLNIDGRVEVFYTGDECDIFATLSKENNYSMTIKCYDGNYELYQVRPTGNTNYEFMCADSAHIVGNSTMEILVRGPEGFLNADKLSGGSISGYAKYGTVIASERERSQAEEMYAELAKEAENEKIRAEQRKEVIIENQSQENNKTNVLDIVFIVLSVIFMGLAAILVVLTINKNKRNTKNKRK